MMIIGHLELIEALSIEKRSYMYNVNKLLIENQDER